MFLKRFITKFAVENFMGCKKIVIYTYICYIFTINNIYLYRNYIHIPFIDVWLSNSNEFFDSVEYVLWFNLCHSKCDSFVKFCPHKLQLKIGFLLWLLWPRKCKRKLERWVKPVRLNKTHIKYCIIYAYNCKPFWHIEHLKGVGSLWVNICSLQAVCWR